jgi:hypothetical protein
MFEKFSFDQTLGFFDSLQLLGDRKLDRTMFVCRPIRNGDRKLNRTAYKHGPI